jgi:hypothetical protein
VKPIKTFHDTAHANERSEQRSIPLIEMIEIINHHDSKTQQYKGDHGGFVYKFKKTKNGKLVSVIAEVKGDECWIISAF